MSEEKLTANLLEVNMPAYAMRFLIVPVRAETVDTEEIVKCVDVHNDKVVKYNLPWEFLITETDLVVRVVMFVSGNPNIYRLGGRILGKEVAPEAWINFLPARILWDMSEYQPTHFKLPSGSDFYLTPDQGFYDYDLGSFEEVLTNIVAIRHSWDMWPYSR